MGRMDLGLHGRKGVVLAASRGLGRAIALELAREGAALAIASRNEARIAEAADAIAAETGRRPLHRVVDVTQKEPLEAFIRESAEALGGLHMLVCNAGGPPAGRFDQLDDEAWIQAFNLNLMSVVRAIRAARPYLEAEGGSILIITSMSVKQPLPGLILSNAFRPAVTGLAKTLSQELAPRIRINCLAPGRLDTERVRELDAIKAEQSGIPVEEVRRQTAAAIPLGRYGDPAELGRLAAFLLSDAASYVTGQTILVDGGLSVTLA